MRPFLQTDGSISVRHRRNPSGYGEPKKLSTGSEKRPGSSRSIWRQRSRGMDGVGSSPSPCSSCTTVARP
eukprot:16012388-Heterocapsa_arctica.AAC.1